MEVGMGAEVEVGAAGGSTPPGRTTPATTATTTVAATGRFSTHGPFWTWRRVGYRVSMMLIWG